MSIRINQMKIALTPVGIARLEFRLQPSRNGSCMHRVHVIDVKDSPAPPAKHAGSGNDIEKTPAHLEAGKPRIRTTMDNIEPQRGVERYGDPHIAGRQRYRAEGFDFCV